MPVIELNQISKFYGEGVGRVQALKKINFQASAGELNLVIGPSGSGKSTFLTITGGLQSPSEGRVLINGKDTTKLSNKERDRMRLEEIGFVLQSYK